MRPPSRRPLRRLGLRLLDRRARRPGRPDLSRHRADRRRALRGGGPARADGPAVPPRPARPKVDHTLEVRRILDGCLPLAGSPAETYLRSRGLSDPALAGPALPPRSDRLRRRTRLARHGRHPARADGAPVGGIHRTFLLDDGSAQGAGGQEDAGLGRGRRGSAVPDRRRRSSRHRRRHRDRALRAGDLRSPDLGRALRRRRGALAVAGRRQARHDLRRRRRCRPRGRRAARRPAQPRGHPERDRRAAPWRRLQRRPAARRGRGGLCAARRTAADAEATEAPQLPSDRAPDHASAPSWKPPPRR